MIRLIYTVFLLVLMLPTFGSQDTISVENLRYSWVQQEEGDISPIGRTTSLNLVAFLVNKSQGDILKVCNDAPVDIWVNMQLVGNKLTSCNTINLDSLREANQSDSLVFHIASKEGLSRLSTEIMQVSEKELQSASISLRANQSFRDFYFTGLVVFLMLIALFRNIFPQRFSRMLLNPFKARGSTVDEYYSDFVRPDNIYFAFVFSFLLSLCLQYFSVRANRANFESFDFLDFSISWSLTLLAVMGFVIAKYLLASIVSYIFNLKGISNIQNQDFLNYLFWIFLTVFGLTILEYSLSFHGGWSLLEFAMSTVAFLAVLFFAGVYFKLSKFISANKMLIISYLCTTEFIPGFIFIYVLLR
ncbi:MAG: DUF4271 domain-containing protein [Cyclobacteriaceae bacterium]